MVLRVEQGVTSVQVWTLVIAGLAVLTSGAGLVTTWALNRRTEHESWTRNQRLARYSGFLATCSELRSYIHDELVHTLSSGPAPAAVREEFRQRQLMVQAKAVEVFLLAKEETAAAVLAYIDWTINGLPAWPSGSDTIKGDPRWTAALDEGISRYISMLAPMRRELGVEDELLIHTAPRAGRLFRAPPSPTGLSKQD
jgi:hypothetical protein